MKSRELILQSSKRSLFPIKGFNFLHNTTSFFGVIPKTGLFARLLQFVLATSLFGKVKDSPATAGVFVEEPLFFQSIQSYNGQYSIFQTPLESFHGVG